MIFILIFYPFKVDDEEVKTIYKGKTKGLNIFQNEKVNWIEKKKQHIKFINKEALDLCSLIKVNATIKKYLITSKTKLGSFCA